MFYGKKPDGAEFYFRRGKMELIVWKRPPLDAMCSLTGRSENRLVNEILEGRWEHIMHPAADSGVCSGGQDNAGTK